MQYLQQKDQRINKQTHKQTSEDNSFSDPYNGSFVFTKTHGDLTKVKGISLPCEIYLPSPQPVSLAPPEHGGGPHDVQGMRCDGAECRTRVVNPNWWQDIISNGAVIPSSIWCQSVFASYLIEYDNEYHLCENMTLRRLVCEIIGQQPAPGPVKSGQGMYYTLHRLLHVYYMTQIIKAPIHVFDPLPDACADK